MAGSRSARSPDAIPRLPQAREEPESTRGEIFEWFGRENNSNLFEGWPDHLALLRRHRQDGRVHRYRLHAREVVNGRLRAEQ